MHKDPMKFEHPERLEELAIIKSLDKLGLEPHHNVCDYGAGTGVVTAEAARITEGHVYALDVDPGMIHLINEKIHEQRLSNVTAIQVKADKIPLDHGTIDRFLMVTVLHHIEDVPVFIGEIHRVLRHDGKVMIIDFHKKETPIGPPVDHRMSAYQAARHFVREGINLEEHYELGDNFYLLVLSKA